MSLKETVTALFKGGDPTTGIGILCDHVEDNYKILKDLHETIKEENGDSINGRLKALTISINDIKEYLIRPTKNGKILNERKKGWRSMSYFERSKWIVMVLTFLILGGWAFLTGSLEDISNRLTTSTEQSE